jgi:hypothetical protein
MPTPPRIFLVRFKWVFVQKRNKNNDVVRYKAGMVAQGFTQRPRVAFNKIYSPVINEITFRYLMTAYLYGSLDSNIYMKVPYGISVLNMNANHNMYCIKLVKSLYGLKQLGKM